MESHDKFMVDILNDKGPDDDGSFSLIDNIDCADLDVVKQQFSKETYEMALSVSGSTEV